MSSPSPAVKELPPHAALMNLTTGHWIAQAIFVAAKLGIADLLREGPRSSGDLAQSRERIRERFTGSCARWPAPEYSPKAVTAASRSHRWPHVSRPMLRARCAPGP